MNERIIIVEDDESIRRLVEVALQGNGFQARGFDNAADALKEMASSPPDVVIMDIMMQGMDGLEAVRRMRAEPKLRETPVIMLTAKDTEADKIVGLDAGADDYMTKPFSVLELCARVRAQVRRLKPSAAVPEQTLFESGSLRLDDKKHLVTLDGRKIDLTLKEYELLKLLMQHAGNVITRSELLRQVWGIDYCGETRTLDMHIGTLRHKLGDPAENSRYIQTVRGVGYRFAGGEDA